MYIFHDLRHTQTDGSHAYYLVNWGKILVWDLTITMQTNHQDREREEYIWAADVGTVTFQEDINDIIMKLFYYWLYLYMWIYFYVISLCSVIGSLCRKSSNSYKNWRQQVDKTKITLFPVWLFIKIPRKSEWTFCFLSFPNRKWQRRSKFLRSRISYLPPIPHSWRRRSWLGLSWHILN